ncbi:Lactonase, 7-bladed beta-propeller-domain-containing protein [Melampsora americana]|nr:Lactonase, 7-bladed beta-propeller-domain-containing protein [Melampsora americana]
MTIDQDEVVIDSIKVTCSVLEQIPTTENQKSSPELGLNSKEENRMNQRIIVGGYAGLISMIEFDESTQKLIEMESLTDSIVGKSPTWITLRDDGKMMYSGNEVDEIDGQRNTGSISCFKLVEYIKKIGSKEKKSLRIEPVNQILSSPGVVAIDISPDQSQLIVASYLGGTASRYELNSDGSFKSKDNPAQLFTYHATGPHPDRQDHSYIHDARYDPTGRIAAFTDLGGDRVYFHSVNEKTGELTPIETVKLKPGSGPRHLKFFQVNEIRTDLYLICELSNEILYFELTQSSSDSSLKIKLIQILNTLFEEVNLKKTTFTGAEIEISLDGKFLYSTTRQTDLKKPKEENSILIFNRDLSNGKLDWNPIRFKLNLMGHTPRHFSFSQDLKQRWMVLATHESNLIGIYGRDEVKGQLKLIDWISVKSLPTFVQFLPIL